VAVVMVGVGNLGQALLGYRGFGRQNFSIYAAFDADPAKVGQTIQGIRVHHIDDLPEVREILGHPTGLDRGACRACAGVAERLVAAGIEGIVNFAPVTLSLPPQVQIVSVDLAIELEQLSFAVTSKLAKAAAESAQTPAQPLVQDGAASVGSGPGGAVREIT
jgi:redox-sensing transcriptional repressor